MCRPTGSDVKQGRGRRDTDAVYLRPAPPRLSGFAPRWHAAPLCLPGSPRQGRERAPARRSPAAPHTACVQLTGCGGAGCVPTLPAVPRWAEEMTVIDVQVCLPPLPGTGSGTGSRGSLAAWS
ncbi:hypothetical protein SKAU_G00345700 [Synaphobranchus kaupii]|uniref:Uncharacterized protein n=1 Tax=Synaphobranchus kaupii TaxID=118154 RepID=A0A9Q1EJI1_SYNKA|nr:hypothetical protein SKAU_G00345700 [Synaphobranchus kaupii]